MSGDNIRLLDLKIVRQELKKDLPQSYDRLVFELDEETLRQVAKKKSREDLRDKFEQWDEELVESKKPLEIIKFSLESFILSFWVYLLKTNILKIQIITLIGE